MVVEVAPARLHHPRPPHPPHLEGHLEGHLEDHLEDHAGQAAEDLQEAQAVQVARRRLQPTAAQAVHHTMPEAHHRHTHQALDEAVVQLHTWSEVQL